MSTGPWYVITDEYRGKRVYVVARIAGRRGGVEYLLSQLTGRKLRFYRTDVAQERADEMNAKATDQHQVSGEGVK
jgi:transcription antitermination factor NusA-like protein